MIPGCRSIQGELLIPASLTTQAGITLLVFVTTNAIREATGFSAKWLGLVIALIEGPVRPADAHRNWQRLLDLPGREREQFHARQSSQLSNGPGRSSGEKTYARGRGSL